VADSPVAVAQLQIWKLPCVIKAHTRKDDRTTSSLPNDFEMRPIAISGIGLAVNLHGYCCFFRKPFSLTNPEERQYAINVPNVSSMLRGLESPSSSPTLSNISTINNSTSSSPLTDTIQLVPVPRNLIINGIRLARNSSDMLVLLISLLTHGATEVVQALGGNV